MPLAKEILPILPRVRRFGQMLIGSQDETDRIIKTCLQGLVDSSIKIDTTQKTAVAVFEIFLRDVNRSPEIVELSQTKKGESDLADEFLSRLVLVERQAFLLRYIEEFSMEETVQIMGITDQGFHDLTKRVEAKLSTPSTI